MITKEQVRNTLGDHISWRSLHAVQEKAYPTREEAIVDCLMWCGRLDHKKIAELLAREFGGTVSYPPLKPGQPGYEEAAAKDYTSENLALAGV